MSEERRSLQRLSREAVAARQTPASPNSALQVQRRGENSERIRSVPDSHQPFNYSGAEYRTNGEIYITLEGDSNYGHQQGRRDGHHMPSPTSLSRSDHLSHVAGVMNFHFNPSQQNSGFDRYQGAQTQRNGTIGSPFIIMADNPAPNWSCQWWQ